MRPCGRCVSGGSALSTLQGVQQHAARSFNVIFIVLLQSFSPNTGRAHGCGTQCANGGHLSAFFRRKQRSRGSNAEARTRAFLLHFHRSTSSQHRWESHSHSCATFLSALKQPLMQVPQAWSAARFNWTMSSCGCVITVWGSNHTPARGKHEWISFRNEGLIF